MKARVKVVENLEQSIDETQDSQKKFGVILGKNRTLSDQEIMVIRKLIVGKTAKIIAKEAGLSFHTVQCYINRAKYKLDCRTKGEIISTCFSLGIN